MEFKSQICTTVEQSKRLLELGLKKKTADMYYTNAGLPFIKDEFHLECKSFKELSNNLSKISPFTFIPAWSLHRLIELMPEVIFEALLCVFKDSIRYEALVFDRIEVLNDVVSDNIYNNAIATIEWLINKGYFNQDYLEEKK